MNTEQTFFIANVVYVYVVGGERLATDKKQHPYNECCSYFDCSQPIQRTRLLLKKCTCLAAQGSPIRTDNQGVSVDFIAFDSALCRLGRLEEYVNDKLCRNESNTARVKR